MLFFAFDVLIIYTNFLSSGIFDMIHETKSDAAKTPTDDTKIARTG